MSTKAAVLCLISAIALSACNRVDQSSGPETQPEAPAAITAPAVAVEPVYIKFLPEDFFAPGQIIARNSTEVDGATEYRQLSQVTSASAAEYFAKAEPKLLAAGFVKGDDADGAKVFNRGAERIAVKITYAGAGTTGVREHIVWSVPVKPDN